MDGELLLTQAADERVVAIGETARLLLPRRKEVQQASFREHIRVARALNKPLIIHTRDAQEDTPDHAGGGASQVGGVLHCFTESLEMAQAAMKMGFYISISGIATFKNAAALQEVVKALPLERLLVETDSPYPAPTGGGKRTGFRSGRCPVYRRPAPDPARRAGGSHQPQFLRIIQAGEEIIINSPNIGAVYFKSLTDAPQ